MQHWICRQLGWTKGDTVVLSLQVFGRTVIRAEFEVL